MEILLVGDKVKLVQIPEWLTHDLPVDEQKEIQSYVGRIALIEKINASGHLWIGFGGITEKGEEADYSGHSFCVTKDCLIKVV